MSKMSHWNMQENTLCKLGLNEETFIETYFVFFLEFRNSVEFNFFMAILNLK